MENKANVSDYLKLVREGNLEAAELYLVEHFGTERDDNEEYEAFATEVMAAAQEEMDAIEAATSEPTTEAETVEA